MWGAIIGDIVGSPYQFANHKSKDFILFAPRCRFTDDTVMTVAIAKTLHETIGKSDAEMQAAAVKNMQDFGKRYPYAGYGGMFEKWLSSDGTPYNSLGNGSAMRVSAVGWFAQTEEDVKRLSYNVTAVTHNHPEGLKGAEAIAMAIFWARHGVSKQEIGKRIAAQYYPQITRMRCDDIRFDYRFDCTCPGSVPHAIVCVSEGKDFEDTIRTAVSIGGDTDTIAAMAGSIAEALYGIPEAIRTAAAVRLTTDLYDCMQSIVYK